MINKQSSQTLATLAAGASLVAAIMQKLTADSASAEDTSVEATKATICNTAQAIFEQELGTSVNAPGAFKG